MVGVRSQDADALLIALPPDISVVLVFGTDPGLISERVRLVIKATGIDTRDPFQPIRLSGAEIAADTSRLLDEANTLGLFSSERCILIELGAADVSEALEIVLREVGTDFKIVIHAGVLKKDAPVRKVCERHRFAIAVECDPDTEVDLARMVDAEATTAGIILARPTKNAILKSLGADRLSTRSELAKLMIYAHGQNSLTVDDVEHLLSNASSVALESTIQFAFSGNMRGLENSCKRLLSAGTDGSTILATALREAIALHQFCSSTDRSGNFDQSLQRYNRGFGRKPLAIDILQKWNLEKATRAMHILTSSLGPSRRDAGLSRELAMRVLWSVAYLVQR